METPSSLKNQVIGGGRYYIRFWSRALGCEALIKNLLDGASVGFFSLVTEMGSILKFPARHKAPMYRLNLYNLEAPERPLNNM